MTLPWKLAFAGIVLAAVLAVGLFIERLGYDRAMEHCRAQQDEIERANREAIRRAHELLLRTADDLALKTMEMNDALSDLSGAAAADPDADRICLSAGAVERLRTIGAGQN